MTRNALRWMSRVACCLCMTGAGCSSSDAPPGGRGRGRQATTAANGGGVLGGSNGGLSGPGLNPSSGGNGTTASSGLISPSQIPSPKVCASAIINAPKNMPTIVFVVDGSGSMCAPFGLSTRWLALRSALLDPMRGLIYRLQDSVNFGLTIYDGTIDLLLTLPPPPPPGTAGAAAPPAVPLVGGVQNPPCAFAYANQKAMGMCPQLVEVLPPKRTNAMAIDMAFPQVELGGSTPTDRAMKRVMDTLTASATQRVQGPDERAPDRVYVILATDGAPNDVCVGGVGGDGSLQRQGVLQAVDRGAAAGITTWVISLAGGDATLQAHLDEVARHGDPKNPMARTFVASNPDALVTTLAQLLGGAIGCSVNLSGKVTKGKECSGTVSLDGKKLACCQKAASGVVTCDGPPSPTPSGWRLSDERTIELLGDSCAHFLIGSDSLLQAEFPCDVFVPG